MLRRRLFYIALLVCLIGGVAGKLPATPRRADPPNQIPPADLKPILLYGPGWNWVNVEWDAYWTWIEQTAQMAGTSKMGYTSLEREKVAFEGDFTPDILASNLAIFCPDHAVVRVDSKIVPVGPAPDDDPQDSPARFASDAPMPKTLNVSLVPGVTYRVRVDYDNFKHFDPKFSGVTLIAWSGLSGQGNLNWMEAGFLQAMRLPMPTPLFAAYPIVGERMLESAVLGLFWGQAHVSLPTGQLTSRTIDAASRKTPAQWAAEDGSPVRGFQLVIKTDKQSYHADEPIHMAVTLKNLSGAPITLYPARLLTYYHVDVTSQDENVPLTRYGRMESDFWGINDGYMLTPGSETSITMPLNQLFDMSLGGTYTVIVSRDIGLYNPKTRKLDFIRVPSNTLEIGLN